MENLIHLDYGNLTKGENTMEKSIKEKFSIIFNRAVSGALMVAAVSAGVAPGAYARGVQPSPQEALIEAQCGSLRVDDLTALSKIHDLAPAQVQARKNVIEKQLAVCVQGGHAANTVAAIPAAHIATIPAAKAALKIGDRIADGSIFAGLTADGEAQIYASPADLGVMSFNDCAEATAALNVKNYRDLGNWQIPSIENLHVLQKNQDQGALRGTFAKSYRDFLGFPKWYWSSTEDRGDPSHADSSHAYGVDFSDGGESWNRKTMAPRLSCRPVRLVAAPSLR